MVKIFRCLLSIKCLSCYVVAKKTYVCICIISVYCDQQNISVIVALIEHLENPQEQSMTYTYKNIPEKCSGDIMECHWNVQETSKEHPKSIKGTHKYT